MIAALALTVALTGAPSDTVDFGPWNGVVECESRGQADAVNRSSGAAGLFQFMPSTWQAVARHHDRHRLAYRHPAAVTVAQQYRQAVRLATMPGGGVRHWDCGYRYGDGTAPVTVEHSAQAVNRPRRCVANLNRRFATPRRRARTICQAGQ